MDSNDVNDSKVTNATKLCGLGQFIYKYNLFKTAEANDSLWGDEIEHCLVKFDHDKKQVYALLKTDKILRTIHQHPEVVHARWTPEVAAFQIEGVSLNPYSGISDCVTNVENSMKQRRKEMQQMLNSDEAVMTLASFPLAGVKGFSYPPFKAHPSSSKLHSFYFPDEALCLKDDRLNIMYPKLAEYHGSHNLFPVPIFRDTHTPAPFVDSIDSRITKADTLFNAEKDAIYIDSLAMASSCAALQCTFQSRCLADALKLHDQLAVLCPVLLALSAATPIYRGYLADIDTRWDAIRYALDDRKKHEKIQNTNGSSEEILNQTTRFDSIDVYLTPAYSTYNDVNIKHCQESYKAMIDAGVEEGLAKLMAHRLSQDLLVLLPETEATLGQPTSTDLIDLINKCYWPSVRLKFPPNSDVDGWHVELRPTEVQATDFQNAAFAVFMFLVSRLILENRLHLIIPISHLLENMKKSGKRDAVLKQKFYSRTSMSPAKNQGSPDETFAEMTVNDIINGNPSKEVTGIAELAEQWLMEQSNVNSDQRKRVQTYITFIRKRASGEVKTVARWMRDFVRSHESYKKDSVVSQEIAYDLLHCINSRGEECFH